MTSFVRSVLKQNVVRAASDDVTDNLPVNPLLCILYTLRAEQAAASTTADTIAAVKDLLAAVTKVEVLFRGSQVMSGSLTDLALMSALQMGRLPQAINVGDATENPVAVTVPLFLGRWGLKGAEAFPATRSGELTLHRVINGTLTNLEVDSLTEQIETYEVIGLNPSSFLKQVTIAASFGATGQNDVDLPMGNPILGALLWGNTPFNATTSVATLSQVQLIVDGVNYLITQANWETLHGELTRLISLGSDLSAHTHTENLAAAYAADVATARPRTSEGLLTNYSWLPFDLFGDGSMPLVTAGHGRVNLRFQVGTADTARVIPLEIVAVPGAGA